MADEPIPFKQFLEDVAPGVQVSISDLGGKAVNTNYNHPFYVVFPDLYLYCPQEQCQGFRFYKTISESMLRKNESGWLFSKFVCRNCSLTAKTFALSLHLNDDEISGTAYKYGELPQFGPPNPPRLISLLRDYKELYLKGRRCENQGLGIAAFAYYRRVIDAQRERIFDRIIEVCNRLEAGPEVVAELTAAKAETQFTKAVETVKHGIPQALLVNGQNPLTLLHDALSEGLHAQTDEECLEIATDIRVVMANFAERMWQALKDEAEVTTAVSRLIQRKAQRKNAQDAVAIPSPAPQKRALK